MDLVYDDMLYVSKVLSENATGEEYLQSLRRGDEHVWRVLGLRCPFGLRCVSVPHRYPEVHRLTELLETLEEVAVERPEGRDVDAPDPPSSTLSQLVEDWQHRVSFLSDSGRSDEQHVVARQYSRYRLGLGLGGLYDTSLAQQLLEPLVKESEFVHSIFAEVAPGIYTCVGLRTSGAISLDLCNPFIPHFVSVGG